MIDNDKFNALQDSERTPTKSHLPSIEGLNEDALFELKGLIEEKLPAASLSSMNLETELVRQYQHICRLQSKILVDDATPANQKAQIANSVAATLGSLVKMQSEFHTSERFKSIEQLMIRYMKKLPVEIAEAFIDEYERLV